MITDKVKLDALVKQNTMLNDNKLSFIVSGIKSIVENKVAGDVVECGVWMGGADVLVSNLLLEYNDVRTFRLFDSFDDPHEPLPVDGAFVLKKLGGIENAKGRLIPIKGFYKRQTKIGPGDAKHVFDLLTKSVGYPEENVKIYKGWFQNTMVPYSKRIEKISLLILDCDFYESTRICIENLYSKIEPNGFIVIDDYSPLDGCRKAIDDYLADKTTGVTKVINGTNFEGFTCLKGGNVWVKKI